MGKRNQRTNLWDYLQSVAKQRTKRVEARNETTQAKVDAGVDVNSIINGAVDQYGGQIIDLAAQAAAAAAGVPVPAGMGASPSAAPTPPPARSFGGRAGGGLSRPGSASGMPSWALPAAIGVGVLVLLRK